jgi:outer membrane lipoprotein-sorting protein
MAAAPLRIVALLATLPLVLSACGQATKDSAEDFQGEQKAVAQAVEDLQSASSKKDGQDKICTQLLAPALVTQIKTASKATCQSALKDTLRDADTFDLTVEKVVVDGDKATATVTSDAGGGKDRTDTLELVKVGNAWKIATLGSAT